MLKKPRIKKNPYRTGNIIKIKKGSESETSLREGMNLEEKDKVVYVDKEITSQIVSQATD